MKARVRSSCLKYPPITIGGKAMQYYKLRNGRDFDYIVHKDDFKTLVKKYGLYDSFPKYSPGVKITSGEKEIDYFLKIGPYNYEFLSVNAIKVNSKLVADKHDLILLKAWTAYIEPEPHDEAPHPTDREKSFADLDLLVNSLYKK